MSSQAQEASGPDQGKVSLDEVFERLYERIRRLAARIRLGALNPTLNATALAHEAYMKLCKTPVDFADKSYDEVIAVFANAMHQILIDAVRRKGAQKRVMVELAGKHELPIDEVLAISASLAQLEQENLRQAQVVRCRFLLGMTGRETAAALGISTKTVERELHEAKERLAVIIRGSSN
jgi:RNA polymerase sigma-70 factor (ECF subfamily)